MKNHTNPNWKLVFKATTWALEKCWYYERQEKSTGIVLY